MGICSKGFYLIAFYNVTAIITIIIIIIIITEEPFASHIIEIHRIACYSLRFGLLYKYVLDLN